MEKNANMVTCSSCKRTYDHDSLKTACPYCGNTRWNDVIVLVIVLSIPTLICLWLFFFVAPGISSTVFRVIVKWVTGFTGFPLALLTVIVTISLLVSKPQLPKEPAGEHPAIPTSAKAKDGEEISHAPIQDKPTDPNAVIGVAKWKEGVEAWSEWREQNAGVNPNLGGANLAGTNLAGADLNNVDLSNADLSGADLTLVHLLGANLTGAKLVRTNLSFSVHNGGTKLHNADLTLANLSGAKLVAVNLSGANLQNANLSDANLNCADLNSVNLRFANLSGADLSESDCRSANLSGTDLGNTNLRMTFYDKDTVWPAGFDPGAAGALKQ